MMTNTKDKGIIDQLRSDRKVLMVAITCGLCAIILMYLYISKKTKPYGEPTPILIAANDISVGDIMSQDNIDVHHFPLRLIPQMAIPPDYLSTILNMSLKIPLSKGQPLLWTYIDQDLREMNTMSEALDKTHHERAVTISVDEISGGSNILPNDHVDIIGTFTIPNTKNNESPKIITKTLLQCVTILAVNGNFQSASIQSPTSVTLKVTAEEAALLTFSENFGHLRLLLRHIDDLSINETSEISFSNLFQVQEQVSVKRGERIRILYGKDLK